MINLNDSQYDAKTSKIFNEGLAGITENVTISVKRKGAEDNAKSPDYKLVIKDEDGVEIAHGFYFVTEATQYKSIEEQIKSQGMFLKHLLHSIINPSAQIPQFSTATDMLNGCMKLIHDHIKANPNQKFRIFTNYGSTKSPKQFIQLRSWVPCIEKMNVVESVLAVSNFDQMSRLEASAPVASASSGFDAPVGDVSTGTTAAGDTNNDW